MLSVVIVDDEPAARRTLRECCERETDLAIIGEYGDATSALSALRARPPDLLFMDIQIDRSNGIALVRSLEAENLPVIVFVTAYDQYALEAFEVSATDYLLKPFDEQRFRDMLARVRRRCGLERAPQRQATLSSLLAQLEQGLNAPSVGARLLAESGGRMHLLDAAQIELIEGDRNYVKLIVGREAYHARSTLQQAEKSLAAQPLLRISRSHLINMGQVREISRTPRGDFIFVLAGGTTVTSSEGFREPVRQHLATLRLGTA